MKQSTFLISSFLSLLLATQVLASELQVARITPKGEDVTSSRQIVVEFNQPVVPLGRMDRTQKEIPVTIEPHANCQWRWLNTSSLACNLDEKDALKPATKYEVTIAPTLQTQNGKALAKEYKSTFITERPAVTDIQFKTWKSPGTPVIRLILNQPVPSDTLERHLSLVSGKSIPSNFTITPDTDAAKFPDLIKLPGEKAFVAFNQEVRKTDDQKTETEGIEARRIWLLTPQQGLPRDTEAVLKIKPGIVSALGPEPGITRKDLIRFHTYPEFEFLGIKCFTNDKENPEIFITKSQNQDKRCNPLGAITLAFSTPVLRSIVKDNVVFDPPLNGNRKDYNPWGEENRDYSRLTSPHEKGRKYEIYLPQGLKAWDEYHVTLPEKITDEFGDTLKKPAEMSFKTDHRKPNFELVYRDAVLEKETDSEVPLYVTNLKKVSFAYRAMTPDDRKSDQVMEKDIPAVQDIQFAVPFGIRDLLQGKSGAVYGLLSTDPLVESKNDDWETRLFAQVTPYQLHVKLGHYNTIVWVTDMKSGQPVANAKLSIYVQSLSSLYTPTSVLAEAVTDENGLAVLPGTEKLDPKLEYDSSWKDDMPILFVRVDKAQDMALLPLSSSYQINSWRVAPDGINDWPRRKYGHVTGWGFTAQGIYRAGDTMQYKIFLRDSSNEHLVPPPIGSYMMEITDPTGKIVETREDITLSSFGAFDGEFKIPQQASMGWYQFRVKAYFDGNKKPENDQQPDSPDIDLYAMRVLVSDFTPAPFRVTTSLNGDIFHSGQNLEIETLAKLHSGGAYTDASSRVTLMLESMPFVSKNSVLQGFQFDSYENETSSQQLYQSIQNLDDKGERHDRVNLSKQNIVYGKLTAESAVQDDRGKYTAGQASAFYAGVDRLIGLKSTQWVYTAKEDAKILYAVADTKGNPVEGTKVNIAIEHQETVAARVKGAGNAYLTDLTTSWKKETSCEGVSKKEPSDCIFKPQTAGVYRITATIKDTMGTLHTTQEEIWVEGKDYVQWDDANDSYLTIIPEKQEYKIGETARYLVKNPYPGAKALITIERFGVINSFVKTFDSSTPIVEFPIKADHVPGFYLSVIVFSPRVDKPIDANQVDLGKPAFRIGYVEVPIKDPAKAIDVSVKTDKEVYRPGDKVHVDLMAVPKLARKDKQPIEIAVSVLDESVFDLIAQGKKAFDPYQGFYSLAPLDLRNYSLLTRLVGRQKFEKKGANPGGDGGNDLSMRNVFKYVSYWNATVKTDKDGKASVDFAVPDNLTGWRVLAIATTPDDLMGLGDGEFKVNKPTELRSVLPNQVSEGDQFMAGFSVMNRTDRKRTIKVILTASGDLAENSKTEISQDVALEPYKRTTVYLPITTAYLKPTRDKQDGTIKFRAVATDSIDKDGLELSVPVKKTRTLETAATYGSFTDAKASENISFPKDIYTDIGDVSLVLSPSVIAGLDGAFRYIRDYPYNCWEQKLTKAIMASHYQKLKPYLDKEFSWPESADLPEQTLAEAASFQTSNGGMAYFVATDDHADPYLSAYTALAFHWLKTRGYEVPKTTEEKLHTYLQNLLKKDLTPSFYSEGMRSTVRAVALNALALEGKLTKTDIERYRPALKEMSLFGKANFLQAALNTKDASKAAAESFDTLLGSSIQSGGKISFNETYDDGYERILATPTRDQCAILSAVLGEKQAGDIPMKIIRNITQTRKGRDYWENTQENVFCMNALADYAAQYESVKPSINATATLNAGALGKAAFNDIANAPITLSRPITEKDPGTKAELTIDRTGEGRLYYSTRVSYATKDVKDAVNAGVDIQREYSLEKDGKWELLKPNATVKRGDLIRVDLYLSLPTARNFLVVNDPLPGGLETVNRDLATASVVDADKGAFQAAGGSFWFKFNDWKEYNMTFWSFYHKELRHDSVRFYSDYLSPGNYHLSYTAQAIADGTFAAAPVKAEEMYDPDVFGRGTSDTLVIKTTQ